MTKSTLKYLFNLDNAIRQMDRRSYVYQMFLYFVFGNTRKTIREMEVDLTINRKGIHEAMTILLHFGFISVKKEGRRRSISCHDMKLPETHELACVPASNKITDNIGSNFFQDMKLSESGESAYVPASYPPSPSLINTLASIYTKTSLELDSSSKNNNTSILGVLEAGTEQKPESKLSGGFTLDDIKRDPDWKTAESILLKYFKPFQICPQFLKGLQFSLLCSLITDPTFDFDGYCRWYRTFKYPKKKFCFGLFLFPNMIAEYKDSLTPDNDSYMNTDSMSKSESFKKMAAEQKKNLAHIVTEMGMDDEEDNGDEGNV